MHALTYTSEARSPLLRSQLDHLLLRAQQRNVIERVTGVLLYTDGRFMQYLEGPEPGLHKVWSIIKADPLHHRIVEEAQEQIWIREFGQWSMAFRAGGEYGMSHPMHLDALLAGRRSGSTGSNSSSINRLLAFWNRHRGLQAF